MALPIDPRLPDWALPKWAERLTQRLTHLLREWAAIINPWIGPSWEDLRFPAQSINPAGTAAPPTVDTTDWPGLLKFAPNAENVIAGAAQLPHSWREGTAIRPHVHWFKSSADAANDGVSWELRWAISKIGEPVGAYVSYTVATLVVGNLTASAVHCLSSFAEIDMTGCRGSDMVLWQLRRDGATDSCTITAVLQELDFHYQIGQVGSSNKKEFPD